jgi:hypothetical protein
VIPAHIAHVFKALDRIERREPQQPMPVCSPLVEGSSPTAGIGTADAGIFSKGDRELGPVVRYWTVKYRRYSRAEYHFEHVIACDPFKATLVVFNRDRSIVEAKVVREVQRDEFEHLTKVSP